MTERHAASMWSPADPAEVREALADVGYLADDTLATAILLALRMQRPLFLEGEPGTGKTEVAKALIAIRGGELIRLQCYEGIDASQALAEWDHPRQLLALRAAEAAGAIAGDHRDAAALEAGLYDERYLIRRPLLAALTPAPVPPVLLIDKIDRPTTSSRPSVEVLSEWAVTIPKRHDPRRGSPDRHRDLQPHARRPRRAQAAVPLPLVGPPRRRA
jgi:MoxR-like ATPase